MYSQLKKHVRKIAKGNAFFFSVDISCFEPKELTQMCMHSACEI